MYVWADAGYDCKEDDMCEAVWIFGELKKGSKTLPTRTHMIKHHMPYPIKVIRHHVGEARHLLQFYSYSWDWRNPDLPTDNCDILSYHGTAYETSDANRVPYFTYTGREKRFRCGKADRQLK